MSMVTSCPACTTTFRITPEQLKKREGKVRCGKCSRVFDAFKSLATLPDEPVSGDAAANRIESQQIGVLESPSTALNREAEVASDRQGRLDIVDPGLTADPPVSARRGAHRRRAVWLIAIVVLGLLLAMQIMYLARDQIAGAWPVARPTLDRICKPLGCTVSFPRRTEQLAIESSDLQTDPQRPNVVVLTATLRNRGNSLVAHPSLELTLTNAQDQAVARKVFQPADYLREPQEAERGMAGMAEINVRIPLDTGDLKPAGYRLFLFYP